MAGSMNGVKIKKITQKMILKGFDTEMNLKEILPEVRYILKNEGYVYGLFKKKVLVGIYALRLEDYYFQKNNVSLKKLDHTESNAVLRLVYSKSVPEIKSSIPTIEKKILVDLKEKIFEGIAVGIEWKNRLIYKQKVYGKGKMYFICFLIALLLGLMIGRILFKDWLIAIYISLGCSVIGLLVGATILHERSIGKVKLTRHG